MPRTLEGVGCTVRTVGARWLWVLLACVSAAVALAGVVLPLLPTTPFALLAAYAAARGSDRVHRWLVGHRSLGPVIRAWQDGRTVARRPKLVATATMAVSVFVLFLLAPTVWLALGVGLFLAVVATWLWLRPEPTAAQASPSSRSASAAPGSRSAGSP